jgi:hypothetical protein
VHVGYDFSSPYTSEQQFVSFGESRSRIGPRNRICCHGNPSQPDPGPPGVSSRCTTYHVCVKIPPELCPKGAEAATKWSRYIDPMGHGMPWAFGFCLLSLVSGCCCLGRPPTAATAGHRQQCDVQQATPYPRHAARACTMNSE